MRLPYGSFERKSVFRQRRGILVIVLITFLASSAGAGIWEIFEFTADKIAGGGMQRGMVDTPDGYDSR